MAENDQHFNIQELAEKWAQGKLSPEEQAYLEKWYAEFDDASIHLKDSRHANSDELRKAILDQINERIDEGKHPVRKLLPWRRIAAAASVLIALSVGGYFVLHKKQPVQIAQNQQHDIAPGRNQATLTLAGGQKIILTKGLSGKLAQQGNTVINANGQSIAYTNVSSSAGNTTIQYNTLTTVRGEASPYPLQLADGTKVWLNAASSITFPTQFGGKERIVKITGEAYFEVVHNAAQSFKVEAADQTIEDIGTTFDVNAYTDEPAITTTLISGSIRINHMATLRPGQAAIQQGTTLKVENVDTESAIAWKNGYFEFDHESLESIMRKVSRWYDVDIEYQPGQKISGGFLGSMTRYTNVSQVLSALEAAGHVKFRISGKTITVIQK